MSLLCLIGCILLLSISNPNHIFVDGTASLTIPPSFVDNGDVAESDFHKNVDDVEKEKIVNELLNDKLKISELSETLEVEIIQNRNLTAALEDCESRLDECLFHVRTLAESLMEENEVTAPSSQCPECPVIVECRVCDSCAPQEGCPVPVECDFSEKENVFNGLLQLKDDELNSLRSEVGNLKELTQQLESSCPAEVQESFYSQLRVLDSDLTNCRNDLAAVSDRYKELEKNHSATEIRLKITKNDLHVAKLNNEQQKLSLDATQLENEAKIEALQKEIHRLNSMLVEARKQARSNRLSEKDNKVLEDKEVQSSICTFRQAFSNMLGFDLSSENFPEESTQQSSTTTVEEKQTVSNPISPTATTDSQKEKATQAERYNASDNHPVQDVIVDRLCHAILFKIFPTIFDFVVWEYSSAFKIGQVAWEYGKYSWQEYLYPIVLKMKTSFRLEHFWNNLIVTHYQDNIKPKTDKTMKWIENYYYEHKWDEMYENHLEPYVDFVIDKSHFFAYYGVQILEGNESPMIVVDYISDLLRLISSVDSIQKLFGDNSETVLKFSVGIFSLATIFLLRRLIAGLALAALGLSVLPLILGLYAILKVMSYFYERKGMRGMRTRRAKSGSGREHSRSRREVK